MSDRPFFNIPELEHNLGILVNDTESKIRTNRSKVNKSEVGFFITEFRAFIFTLKLSNFDFILSSTSVFSKRSQTWNIEIFSFQDETTALDYDLNQLENLLRSEEEEMQRTKELYEVLEK